VAQAVEQQPLEGGEGVGQGVAVERQRRAEEVRSVGDGESVKEDEGRK
jgi:hypothetical protein